MELFHKMQNSNGSETFFQNFRYMFVKFVQLNKK